MLTSIRALADFISDVVSREDTRALIGIVGPPGAGKSAVAAALARQLDRHPGVGPVAVVPMDGFHLENAHLDVRGLRSQKGAPETFDAEMFLRSVRKLRAARGPMAWPGFSRLRDAPLPGAIEVPARTRTILIEGNYLLLDRDPWRSVPPELNATIFLRAPDDVLRRRLMRRQLMTGVSEATARAHVEGSDMANVELVKGSEQSATAIAAIPVGDPDLAGLRDPATNTAFRLDPA